MIIQSDYHIHAAFYRAKKAGDIPGPKAWEQVESAKASGSKIIGILEHCNHSPRHPFSCLEELSQEYYSNDFNRENVYLGVEADLEEDGSDACGKAGREKLQLHYVIGSVHLSPPLIDNVHDYIISEYKRISNALKYNSNIDIIGHPFGEGIRWERANKIEKWSWSLIPENYLKEIIHLAKEQGKALEINRCDIEDIVYKNFLNEIKNEKVLFSVGSDAHCIEETYVASQRTTMLEELGFTELEHWRVKK